jgi:branched-subunit amino acid ABC-type transport system permease component
MSVLTTGRFWAATAERGIRTVAQAAVAAIGVNVVALSDVDWVLVAGTAGLAGVLSVLMSVAAAGVDSPGPSFGPEELKPKV